MNNATKRPTAKKLIKRQHLTRLAIVLTLCIVSIVIVKPTFSQAATFSVPYHANSIWNKPIGANPVLNPQSAQMIQALTGTVGGAVNIDGITGAWSVPVYYADATTPRQQVCDADGVRGCVTIPVP